MQDRIEQPDTRGAILAQARELFLTLGYHKTTMRSIAEAAGIGYPACTVSARSSAG